MSYSKEELDAIFAKGDKIRGKDPDRYRRDACGNEILTSILIISHHTIHYLLL